MRNFWNFVQFQLGWFALVLSAASGLSWLGIAFCAGLLAFHLAVFAKPNEWQLLLVTGAVGWMWESALQTSGLLVYPNWNNELLIAPPWMALLWVNFAATLLHSLHWLLQRPLVCALFGAIGGPFAFWAGKQFGAVAFGAAPVTSLFTLALAWALLVPAVMKLAEYLFTAHNLQREVARA